MQLNPEQLLERMAVGDRRIIGDKFVWRVQANVYRVNGEDVKRRSNEPEDKVFRRVLFVITGDPAYQETPHVRGAKYEAHLAAVKASQQAAKHPCADCGKPVNKKAKRCWGCANEAKRQYPRAECRICKQERPPYRNDGRGSRKMLDTHGVCPDCRDEYARRITAGEMEP